MLPLQLPAMLVLLLLELLLPLALALWLAVRPLAGRFPHAMQILATGLVLLALTFVGIWPAWWLPWAYWLIFAAALLAGLRSAAGRGRSPRRRLTWIAAALLAVAGAAAGFQVLQAIAGRAAPSEPAIDLRFPLRDGRFYVVNGGFSESISSHMATIARATPRQRAYYGQSFAVDLVKVGPWGFTARGLLPRDPARYAIFGAPIFAPCSGRVIQAVDGLPDMPVPRMDPAHMAGNHVLVRCGRADILLAHMRRSSVRVRPGQSVRTGDRLGEVGNSGNTSLPHLHIHAQTPGTEREPLSGAPIPMRFGGRFLLRGDRP